MLTTKQYAQRKGVKQPRVNHWCRIGLLPGVEKVVIGENLFYYLIPESSLDFQAPTQGRPRKARG